MGLAETVGAHTIFIGANDMDYSGYPDCRPEFIAAFNNLSAVATAEAVSGGRRIVVEAPLMKLTKSEIIDLGTKLGVDFSLTMSCYAPKADGASCGLCESCVLRLSGFKKAGLKDPVPYA
jgi:7-cyano-7-deazaguanine synthase